ncbi:hypothetical protein [Piscirickettsia litoralis]|uniref:hypothetical protein n=1 Tax=Piscirickettsia litoralis TaxID=1891921 RepID=UPI001300F510|nr:hypothetical protein [Piscirickettsia litoralis]
MSLEAYLQQAKKQCFIVTLNGLIVINDLEWQYEYTGYVIEIEGETIHLDPTFRTPN